MPGIGKSTSLHCIAYQLLGDATNEPAITNLGTIDFTTDAATFNLGNVATLTNSGTIEKTGGTGTA